MNERIMEIVRKSEFAFWDSESHRPPDATVDWSSNYDRELVLFAENLIKECSKLVMYGEPSDGNRLKIGREINDYFGVK